MIYSSPDTIFLARIYFIMAFGRGKIREFTNIIDPDSNWPEKWYLVTNKSCTGPMTYQKKSKDEAKNDEELDDRYLPNLLISLSRVPIPSPKMAPSFLKCVAKVR